MPPAAFDAKAVQKYWKPETPALIRQAAARLADADPFTKEHTERAVHALIAERDLNTGAVMNALRLCLVGAAKGPGLFDIISILGKTVVEERIACALEAFPR